MFWYLGKCTGLTGFQLELGSSCDVTMSARLCLGVQFGGADTKILVRVRYRGQG